LKGTNCGSVFIIVFPVIFVVLSGQLDEIVDFVIDVTGPTEKQGGRLGVASGYAHIMVNALKKIFDQFRRRITFSKTTDE